MVYRGACHGVKLAPPYALPGLPAERFVTHCDMNSGPKHNVDIGWAVRCKENNSLMILKETQEDRCQLQIAACSLCQKEIRIVQEEDSMPFSGYLKDVRELGCNVFEVGAEVARGDRVEWGAQVFSDGFGGESFAYAGRAG